MRMIEVEALDNGAHKNQDFHGILPDGWAVIPADMETPNFPFGDVEVSKVDGVMTVTKWTPGEMPEPVERTPAEKREEAYNTLPLIEWEDEIMTVTQAATKWQYYAAEGDTAKSDELTALIASAKKAIREQYPDEE